MHAARAAAGAVRAAAGRVPGVPRRGWRSASRSTTTAVSPACRSTSPRRSCPPRSRLADRRRPGAGRRAELAGRRGGRGVRRRRPRAPRRPRPRTASPTSTSSTRWTAAPPASAMVCRYFGQAVSLPRHPRARRTRRPTARACRDRARRRGARARARARCGPRRAGSTSCRCRRSCHWGGNHWVVLYEVGDEPRARRRPGARRCARSRATEFEEKWTRLRGAVRADARPSRRCPRRSRATPGSSPFLRPHRAHARRAPSSLALLAAALELVLPILTQVVVDDALPNERHAACSSSCSAAIVGVLVAMTAATLAPAVPPQPASRSASTRDARLPDRAAARRCR